MWRRNSMIITLLKADEDDDWEEDGFIKGV
jgi:hypothetical protein